MADVVHQVLKSADQAWQGSRGNRECVGPNIQSILVGWEGASIIQPIVEPLEWVLYVLHVALRKALLCRGIGCHKAGVAEPKPPVRAQKRHLR